MSEKYEFIAAECAGHETAENDAVEVPTVSQTQMCALLGVSKSGYHEWLNRQPSVTEKRREVLKRKIEALFKHFNGVYGYRRIHAQLVRGGEQVGEELVRDLLRALGLVTVQPRAYRVTTVRGAGEPDTPDLVNRDFTAESPGTKLVSDISYISTWQGWMYLCTVIDCYNKEVIGYAMADHMRTELVTDALDMAARNHRLADGCIMHSDRGAQYTSAEYLERLAELGLRHSLGRTGVCWDNALAESFFASLKNERVHQMVYPTRKKAREDVARYIELFYNRRRLHSALRYRTPHEVRNDFLNLQEAA